MKKIFLSCLFFIALLIFPHKADALRGRANCSFSPPQIQSGDNSTTFTIGSTQPGRTYEIVIDVNREYCGVDIVSPRITATGNTVSYVFTLQNEGCFGGLVAVKPDNHNDISLREVGGPLICTSEYRVASSCRLDYSPRDLSINQTIHIAGAGLPRTATCIGISGPSYKKAEISLQNGAFLKTIDDGLSVAGNYQVQAGYSIVDPASGEGICNPLSECPTVPIGVGLPGQPVHNPGPGSGGSTPITPIDLAKGCSANAINTAIGCIPIGDTNSFVGWFLKWAIGIAGGIAFLLIIFSGFQIMTSSNNPQQLQTGRELLTAAVSGLILIIFSAFLLKLIGVDILGIPGLGSP